MTANIPAHPLLTPSDTAKYVPYTPRQRLATTSTPHPKPQLANLRAAAQGIGLEPTSVGWSILDKIAYEGDASDEWSEIWTALTRAKAALLLPSESSPAHDVITPDFVQDHLVLCDLASRDNTAVVTLSGLRGQLVNDNLTFRSSLHRSTKHFQALSTPSAARTASLDALPPLPVYPLESSYPSFTVSAFSASLPLPSKPTKPPLPPRPGVRGAPAPSAARLAMPFVSFFGQRPSTPPPVTTTATPAPSTAPPPIELDSTIDIAAFVVDTVLSRTDIATAIISALKGEIAIALNDQPPWLVERVHTFSIPYLPFVRVPAGKKKLQDIGTNPNRVVYAVNVALDKPDALVDKFQAFYSAVDGELRRGHLGGAEAGDDAAGTGSSHDLKLAEEKEDEEARIRDVLETIESTLCTLLYDRLFLPSTSDDASHNEALSSRIAALNMLDLSLEHLDIDVGDASSVEVDALVRTCGQTLSQLDLTARSPREKAAVLVSAHKLVVEGLSAIPPIRLKVRDEADKHPTVDPSNPTDLPEDTSAMPTASVASIHISPPSEPTDEQNSPVSSVHLSISPDRPTAIKPPPASETIPPPIPSPVSGDVLLPLLIFSVVKANPRRLVSHLLFTQRFRNQSFGGEESYCLINLMAVAEFLENVDLGVLGLGESEKKVLSTADLTPIPIARPSLPESSSASTLPSEDNAASIRGRVGLGVDAIAGSANKVILGVVDSSFGVLRALLPGQTVQVGMGSGTGTGTGSKSGNVGQRLVSAPDTSTGAGSGMGETDAALWGVRPGLGLLRRETGFSIVGLAAALPGGAGRTRSQSHLEEMGQRELVEVSSRPPSFQSGHEEGEMEVFGEGSMQGSEDEGTEAGKEDAEAETEGEAEAEEEEEEIHDTRSIKSFESMLNSGRTTRKTNAGSSPVSYRRRKRLTDLTDRLAHGMTGVSKRAQGDAAQGQTWVGRLPPPNRRFIECTEKDIRVSEVGELLREYQRLVEAVRSVGGFQE